ncbi:hypothetical protein Tco_0709787 [Tanacetum coccineum]
MSFVRSAGRWGHCHPPRREQGILTVVAGFVATSSLACSGRGPVEDVRTQGDAVPLEMSGNAFDLQGKMSFVNTRWRRWCESNNGGRLRMDAEVVAVDNWCRGRRGLLLWVGRVYEELRDADRDHVEMRR